MHDSVENIHILILKKRNTDFTINECSNTKLKAVRGHEEPGLCKSL